ncbi:unnamed protein product [Linum tenue]|uniref:Uncharacterized protein n=1 Tax=Linum tenue TaxID=586396 RepID=A0AAV0LU46_9ROSI|nr:unnamed protein product [Linum tenue]
MLKTGRRYFFRLSRSTKLWKLMAAFADGLGINVNDRCCWNRGIGVVMMPPKRKKWTEAEEKTLIAKYGEMVSDGTLAKMKTREKKFRPIALFVNSVHHARDPIAHPWQWTWKDVSTKVQNMRHQYLLVKQKVVRKPEFSMAVDGAEAGGDGVGEYSEGDEFDWVEGLTHWSNFLL